MITFTGLSLSGRLRILAVAASCVLLLISLYQFSDYRKLPFVRHDAPIAVTASIAHSTSASIESLASSVATSATAVSSTPIFREPSLSTFKTSTALKTAIAATASASSSPTQQAENNVKEPLGAIVAAAMDTTDISWMHELADNWTLYPYVVNNPSPPPELSVPQNKGHEAMVYLTFIINNWAQLPRRVIFVHGHRSSWHQEGDIVALVRSLRLPALESAGYVPLRCDWYPSCPAEIRPVTHDAVQWGPGVHREDAERGISDAWETLFPGVAVPETIASQCCAQFAVTREAIQKREKKAYEGMREWILNTTLIDDVSGRVLEKLWAFIMTGDAVHCPPPQQCACEYFGQCGDRDWPRPPEGLQMWPSQ